MRHLYYFSRWEAFEGTQREQVVFSNLEKEAFEETQREQVMFSLEKLPIRHCPALTALSEASLGVGGDYSMFPQLEKLSVRYCSALTALSEAPLGGDYSMARSAFPALKVLKLEHLQRFQRWDTVKKLEEQR